MPTLQELNERDLTKQEKNAAIAQILGFKKHTIKRNGSCAKGYNVWHWPEEWRHLKKSSPAAYIPDFMRLINDMSDIYETITPNDRSAVDVDMEFVTTDNCH